MPFDQHDGGVVAALPLLVVHEVVDEAAQGFCGVVACCHRTDDGVGETLLTEEIAVGCARFGDAVGVEQDAVAGLEANAVLGGRGVAVESQGEWGLRSAFQGVEEDGVVPEEQGRARCRTFSVRL